MNRRDTITALLAFGAPAFPAVAQQLGKIWHIGYLTNGPGPASGQFRDALRDLGYVEGKNLVIESRFAGGNPERMSRFAAELVQLKLDVIFCIDTPATFAAQKATTTIPIVMSAGDPVGAGFVASLARPGGNITGIATIDRALHTKRLELLLSVTPKASKVAMLTTPTNPGTVENVKAVQEVAKRVGKSVFAVEARTPEEIENAFSVMVQQNAGAVLVSFQALFVSERRRIAELAEKNRLPSIAAHTEFAEAGGLFSYGVNSADRYRLVATYVDRIFKGAKPADLPVEQPTKLELIVNLKTAKALGIAIPREMLLRADRVIE